MTDKPFSLKLHQAEPCFYELLKNGEPLHTRFGKWVTFEDGEMGSFFTYLLNELHEQKESWKKSYIEEMGDTEEQSKTICELIQENEKLKNEINNLQAKINILQQSLEG